MSLMPSHYTTVMMTASNDDVDDDDDDDNTFVYLCVTCSDQFARAFHRGSRPSSALSGNVPSPIDRVQEPLYGNYADEQFYKSAQVMPEGRLQQLHILTHAHTLLLFNWSVL